MKYGNYIEQFSHDSYSKVQIGNDKKTITVIYDYLSRINISENDIKEIIENIAYLTKGTINIPLYLEILTKSYSFASDYGLNELIKVVKEIHDVYYDNSISIPLEEYIHDTEDVQLKKLFLGHNNKYLLKSFKKDVAIDHIADLKFAAAIVLDKKDYQEFLAYIDDYENYQETYSPLILFKTYMNLRNSLKKETKLFWDVLFGNEYIVSLNKNNITIRQVFKKENKLEQTQQLNLFSLNNEQPKEISNDIKTFQISTIYSSKDLPTFNQEKEYIMYFRKLGENKDSIILPKLKTNNYNYNIK